MRAMVSTGLFVWFALATVIVADEKKTPWDSKWNEKTTFSISEMPLNEAVAVFAEQMGAQIFIDTKSIEEEGTTPDAPVSVQATNISRKAILKLMLEPIGLVCENRDEYLWITTKEAAASRTVVRYYDVRDLLTAVEEEEVARRKKFGSPSPKPASEKAPAEKAKEATPAQQIPTTKPATSTPEPGTQKPAVKPQFGGGAMMSAGGSAGITPPDPADFQPSEVIRRLVVDTLAPDSWEDAGGIGRLSIVAGVMVVSQTEGQQEAVEDLLLQMRKILQSKTTIR